MTSPFNQGPQPDTSTGSWKTILQLDAERTRQWLTGENTSPWDEGLLDPQMRMRFKRQRARIVAAVDKAREQGLHLGTVEGRVDMATLMVRALNIDSPETAKRMRELSAAASTDGQADRSLSVMFQELFRFANLMAPEQRPPLPPKVVESRRKLTP